MSGKTATPRTIEDPRMLREQIRVADAAYNCLQERYNTLERELTQWREVAGRLAAACRTSYDASEWPANGTSEQEQAADAYDALSKSREGKV